MIMNETRKENNGFTIIELMVTITILAILVVMAAPSFTKSIAKKRTDDCVSINMSKLRDARAKSFGGSTNLVAISTVNCVSDVTISRTPNSFPTAFAYKRGRPGIASGNAFNANVNRVFYTFSNAKVPGYEKKVSVSLSGKITITR